MEDNGERVLGKLHLLWQAADIPSSMRAIRPIDYESQFWERIGLTVWKDVHWVACSL